MNVGPDRLGNILLAPMLNDDRPGNILLFPMLIDSHPPGRSHLGRRGSILRPSVPGILCPLALGVQPA
jgi:hypothetical protein